jgi:hypothetical protein
VKTGAMKIRSMKQNIVVILVQVIAFGLVVFFYLFFLGGSIYEAAVFPRVPQKVTLAQAVEMDLKNKPDFLVFDKVLYVSIADAVWECASVKQSGYSTLFSDKRRTDAVFTDASKTAVVFIQVDGFYNCQQLKENEISGELQRVDGRPIEYQSDTIGTTTIGENSKILTYRFCTHCNPFYAVSLPIVFVLIPLVIWGIYEYWKRR